MPRTLGILFSAASLLCAALWARDRVEVAPQPPPAPVPAPPPASQLVVVPPPLPVAVVTAPEPAPEPEAAPEPVVVAEATPEEEGCDCGYEEPEPEGEPEATGIVDATVSLYYRCHGSPRLAQVVFGEEWKGYQVAPGEDVCFADVDPFMACDADVAEYEAHEKDLIRLDRRTTGKPVLHVQVNGGVADGEKVWAWGLQYDLEDVGTFDPVQHLRAEWARVLGEVTAETQVIDVPRYDGMVYGVVSAPDPDTALDRVRAAVGDGMSGGETAPSDLIALPSTQGPVRRCP